MAQRLARRHGAELTACYAVRPALLNTPWALGEGMAPAAALLAEVDRTQLERARATYEQALAYGPVLWAEADAATLESALLERALYADLLVLGQHDAGDLRCGALPRSLAPDLIADSGKPALVVPYAGAFEPLARQVLVAWKPAREAARAVTHAMPWLQQAEQVHLATQAADAGGAGSSAELEHWLRLNGVNAPFQHHRLGGADVGAALLSLAADSGAELLVMGCYGHSRAREWVLGGATRSVLDAMTLPVLMAH